MLTILNLKLSLISEYLPKGVDLDGETGEPTGVLRENAVKLLQGPDCVKGKWREEQNFVW